MSARRPVEAAGGQLAERDFRPQAGQVRLAVEPRDAQGVQSLGQPAAVLLAVVRGRPAHGLDADLQGGWPAVRAGVQGQHPAPARTSCTRGIGLDGERRVARPGAAGQPQVRSRGPAGHGPGDRGGVIAGRRDRLDHLVRGPPRRAPGPLHRRGVMTRPGRDWPVERRLQVPAAGARPGNHRPPCCSLARGGPGLAGGVLCGEGPAISTIMNSSRPRKRSAISTNLS